MSRPPSSFAGAHEPPVPGSPVAAGLAVAAAAGLGVALILATFASDEPALGIVWTLAIVALGGVAALMAVSAGGPRGVVGGATLRGIATVLVVAGAYLTGATILGVLLDRGDALSSTGIVLLLQGLPLAALVVAALLGSRAALVGAPLVAVPLALVLLGNAGLGLVPLSLLGLAGGVAGLVLLLVAPPAGRAGELVAVAGAVAASAGIPALGTTFSSFGALGTASAFRSLPSGSVLALLVLAGLVLSGAIAVAAVARRRTAGAVVAAITLAAPTVLVIPVFAGRLGVGDAGRAVTLVLALLVLAAAAALAAPAGRQAVLARLPVRGRVRMEAVPAGVWPVGLALALVLVVLQPVRISSWDARLLVVLVVVLLAAAAWIAARDRTAGGAIVAGAVLVAVAITSPWRVVAHGEDGIIQASPQDPGIGAVLAIVATVAAVGWLVPRHPRPGVVAAATYLVLTAFADVLGALVGGRGPTELGSYDPAVDLGAEAPAVVVTFLPVGVVLVGAVLVVALGRGTLLRAGLAAGAVAAAAGGFAAPALTSGGSESVRSAVSSTAFAPTASLFAGRETGATTALLLIPVILAAVAFAAVVVRRPSAPAAAAAGLLVVTGTLAAGTASDPGVLGAVVVAVVALLLSGCAMFAISVAPGARDRPGGPGRPADPGAPDPPRPEDRLG